MWPGRLRPGALCVAQCRVHCQAYCRAYCRHWEEAWEAYSSWEDACETGGPPHGAVLFPRVFSAIARLAPLPGSGIRR